MNSFGNGDDFYAVRWNFILQTGAPVRLSPSLSLELLCADDMNDLSEHGFMVQGQSVPATAG